MEENLHTTTLESKAPKLAMGVVSMTLGIGSGVEPRRHSYVVVILTRCLALLRHGQTATVIHTITITFYQVRAEVLLLEHHLKS